MTVRVYTYQNGGLPSDTSHQSGEFTRMIKASLVTGTEQKTSAGWKLIYDNQEQDRIVIQSQSTSSEQMYYEIVGNLSNVFKISMSAQWVDEQLVNPITVYISKIGQSWSGQCVIIADDKFVWFIANHAIGAFGDFEQYTTNPQSVILGCANSASANDNRALPSLVSLGNNLFYNINKQVFALRHYNPRSRQGFAIAINGAEQAQQSYGHESGANIVQKVELYQNATKPILHGFIPHLCYCDKFINTGEISSSGKKIYQSPILSQIGALLFEVDEL